MPVIIRLLLNDLCVAMESSRAHSVRAPAVFRNPLAKNKRSEEKESKSNGTSNAMNYEPQQALYDLLNDRYGSALSFDNKTNKFSIALPHTTARVDNTTLVRFQFSVVFFF